MPDRTSTYRQVRVLLHPQATRTTVSVIARTVDRGRSVDRLLLRPGSLWVESTDVSTAGDILARCGEALTAAAAALGSHAE